jgi:hypothetical protein
MAGSIVTCNSFKLESLNGLHQPGNVYKIALYPSGVGLTDATTAYSTDNEVAATPQTKYTTGGLTSQVSLTQARPRLLPSCRPLVAPDCRTIH